VKVKNAARLQMRFSRKKKRIEHGSFPDSGKCPVEK